jgi:hypothetical protein
VLGKLLADPCQFALDSLPLAVAQVRIELGLQGDETILQPSLAVDDAGHRSEHTSLGSAGFHLELGRGGAVEDGDEALRRDGAVRVLAQISDLIPVDVARQPYPEPAPTANVRWAEKPVGLGLDQVFLCSRWGRAPQMGEMVVVVPG